MITLLDEGQEVIRAGTGPTRFHDLGCLCRIVDFESLTGGLLGITVEGEAETWIGQAHQEDDGLWCAPVHAAEVTPLPEHEPVDDLRAVMTELASHPLLDNLLPPQDIDSLAPSGLVNQLCCWLPMTEVQKQSLLTELDQQQRLAVLRQMLEEWMRH